MKFEYEAKDQDHECVAYIDKHNHLVVRNSRSCGEEDASFVFMTTSGKDTTTIWDEFDPSDAVHKLYPGDKITITF